MGFRTGAYAKVWEVKPFSDTSVRIRLSISRKNKSTGEYEQDFSGYVTAVGTAAALAVEKDCLPRAVGEYMSELQKLLLDDDCFLPKIKREMPELTKNAELTAEPLGGSSGSPWTCSLR